MQACAHEFVYREEFQLLAPAAVIALLRFFQTMQIIFQFFFLKNAVP